MASDVLACGWGGFLNWIWLPQLYFEGLEMCPFYTFSLHLKCLGLCIPKDTQSSGSAQVELPEHAKA